MSAMTGTTVPAAAPRPKSRSMEKLPWTDKAMFHLFHWFQSTFIMYPILQVDSTPDIRVLGGSAIHIGGLLDQKTSNVSTARVF